MKVLISGCVICAVTVEEVVGVVTPISVETGMTAPKAVCTLASTAGVDVCVICACEEDYNDCDDIEAQVLADLVILFIALPIRKCMHKDVHFP
jgi:hypothetical protein